MDFKEIFLKLTDYTVPFGFESELEPILPSGYKKDTIGNYYYVIGDSETLFTSHLDTSCIKREKVNHIIEGDIIKTDGTTILGGDNKAGCCILFYLIEQNIPGTYYFFLGEEVPVHNNLPHGSLMAIDENPNFFKKFKRVISFDRKEMGSLVTRQFGQNLCSDDFSNALIIEFSKNGIEYKTDKTGYYTDSAFFMNLIPEIVNLSCGVWNEHGKNEYVNIKYTESVAKSATKVDWESLPTIRIIDNKYVVDPRKDSQLDELTIDKELFGEVFKLLRFGLGFVCHEIRNYKNFLNHFISNRKYNFTKWHEDDNLEVSVSNNIIRCNGIEYSNIEDFKISLGMEKISDIDLYNLMLSEFKQNDMKLSDARFGYLMSIKYGDLSKLKSLFNTNGYSLNKIGKGYELIKLNESFLITKYSIFLEKYIK
jgi:hypothetical protein